MERRALGSTGLTVPVVGLGAGPAGDPALDEAAAARLLHGALDLGVALIDTARSYGLSEERIGRHLAGRRAEFVLATKVGYGAEGVPDWTPECVAAGVERALRVLRTDWIDVVLLHSCPAELLAHGGLQEALVRAREAGKIRVAGYSGDGAALDAALADGRFGAVECSVNLVDRAALAHAIPAAVARRAGVLAKRQLANAAWRADAAHAGPDRREYRARWERLAAAFGRADELESAATFLRFAAHAPGVHACLVGTASLDHLADALASVARGPLDPDLARALDAAYAAAGPSWPGLV